MLTTMETEYGGIVSLIEHPDWDDNRKLYAARLVRALRHHLDLAEEDLSNHGEKEFG